MELQHILFVDIETVPQTYTYGELKPETRQLWDSKWQYSKETTAEQHYSKAGIFAEFFFSYFFNEVFNFVTRTEP